MQHVCAFELLINIVSIGFVILPLNKGWTLDKNGCLGKAETKENLQVKAPLKKKSNQCLQY